MYKRIRCQFYDADAQYEPQKYVPSAFVDIVILSVKQAHTWNRAGCSDFKLFKSSVACLVQLTTKWGMTLCLGLRMHSSGVGRYSN